MRISRSIYVVLAFILGSFALTPILTAATGSLVDNGSFAQVQNSAPVGWQTDNWGSLQASFSLNTTGQDDASSAHIAVTNYVDGDAKWMFSPVAITAGQSYTYTDYTKSDATTHIWARFVMQDATVQYRWLKAISPSAAWQANSVTFDAPTNVSTVSVFHVLNATGSLDIDNVGLSANITCSKVLQNGTYNGSFETSCLNTAAPDYWAPQTYGSINASFSYSNTGTSGQKSVGITVASTTGGEASWVSDATPVTAGGRYTLTTDIQSTIYSYAYLEYQLPGGGISYGSLAAEPATGPSWSKYTDTFVPPADATSVKIYFATSAAGNVQLDNVQLTSLAPSTNSFTKGVVSITFDDGLLNTYNNGLSVINKYGYKATWYINASALGASGFMNKTQVKRLSTLGQEIGSHSYQHIDLVTLDAAQQSYQISTNKLQLEAIIGKPVVHFASPYGSYNSGLLSLIMASSQTHRNTSGKLNYAYAYDPSNINAKVITNTMTTSDVDALIASAEQQKAWLVLVYHGIAASGDEYTITKANLDKQIALLKKHDVTVQTLGTTVSQLK